MKKIFFIILVFGCCVACSNKYSEIEKKLKDYAVERSQGMIKDYSLQSLVVDTITVKALMDSLVLQLDELNKTKVNKEDFIVLRNREFSEFRSSYPGYEQAIMSGELKDASEWCTLLRINTEKADSLISNWDSLPEYSYDMLYLIGWYTDRSNNYYNSDNSWEFSSFIEELKPVFDKYNSIQNLPKDSVMNYRVNYQYTFTNSLLNNIKVKVHNIAVFDPSLNLISVESVGSSID